MTEKRYVGMCRAVRATSTESRMSHGALRRSSNLTFYEALERRILLSTVMVNGSGLRASYYNGDAASSWVTRDGFSADAIVAEQPVALKYFDDSGTHPPDPRVDPHGHAAVIEGELGPDSTESYRFWVDSNAYLRLRLTDAQDGRVLIDA